MTTAGHPTPAHDPGDNPDVELAVGRWTRRTLLSGAAAAGVGAAAGLVAAAGPAGAANGNPVELGTANSATATTAVSTTAGDGLQGVTTGGSFSGVAGHDNGSAAAGTHGVFGGSTNNIGVCGQTGSASGLIGSSLAGTVGDSSGSDGVLGLSADANGIHGIAGEPSGVTGTYKAGVLGDSSASDGVIGLSATDVGVMGLSGASASFGEIPSGVWGQSADGYGVLATTTGGVALWAIGGGITALDIVDSAVQIDCSTQAALQSLSTVSYGVVGVTSGHEVCGVSGQDDSPAASGSTGVTGISSANVGVLGSGSDFSSQTTPATGGVVGTSHSAPGVIGLTDTSIAVLGRALAASGLLGSAVAGVVGDSSTKPGVAGYSSGNDGVTGTTSEASSSGVAGVDASATGGVGTLGTSTLGAGVAGTSTSGHGVVATGGLAPLLLTPAATAGAPTSGTHAVGELYTDLDGAVYSCVGQGLPGTWVKLGASTGGLILGSANSATAATSVTTAVGSGLSVTTSADGDSGLVGADTSTGGGSGVSATSTNGVGLVAGGGQAPLLLTPAATAGAPTTGSHEKGELYTDSDGQVWVCTSTGSPGTWFQVAAAGPTAYAQGAFCLLPDPIRLLDTRVGSTDAVTQPATPITAGSTFPLQVTGQPQNAIEVPANAVAVIGNVTAVNATARGFLTLWPNGGTKPPTSSLNYPPSTSQANGVIVALSATGKMSIFSLSTTDVIFDASGFIA